MRQELAALGNGAHALAIQILGNADDAADAVHDALVLALKRPSSYDASKGALRPWFMRVVRSRCIDMLRRRRPDEHRVDELQDEAASPEQLTDRAQKDALVQNALQSITPEQRQIVVLRDYLDMSYAEIANVLDIASGTVMSRLHRARLALREEIRRHHE